MIAEALTVQTLERRTYVHHRSADNAQLVCSPEGVLLPQHAQMPQPDSDSTPGWHQL